MLLNFRFYLIFSMIGILALCSSSCTKAPEHVAIVQNGKVSEKNVLIEDYIDESARTYIIVRHAEKANDGEDPNLTPTGVERAKTLSRVLQNVNLSAVYSTDYKRTRQTAMPSAAAHSGNPLRLYSPSDFPGFIAQTMAAHPAENILVVGHSNSSPSLVNTLLGENTFSQIPETEYDNLYVVNVSADGKAEAVHLKFGEGS